ncbi:leucine-rich repeat transmembrane neuronal protein 1-like [Alosa alosa]|uniref:leucine-rich repeat transmembrane neuronal protein 1-like n=1 Tax=Alosa alosa TaxID=278164 RepID=UPI002015558C|nr:leucine-rich repeat transmembrane neuronal protein 1-like [Alosa alosa]
MQLLREITDIMQHKAAILCPSLKLKEEQAHSMFEDPNLAWFLTLADYDVSYRELCLSSTHCSDYTQGVGGCTNSLHCIPGNKYGEVCDWDPMSLKVGTTEDGHAVLNWTNIPDTRVEEEGMVVALFENDHSSDALAEKAVDGLTSGSFPTEISLDAGLQVRLLLKPNKTLWRGPELDDANVFVTSLDSEGRCPLPCRCEGRLRYCDNAELTAVPQDLIGSSGLSLRYNHLLYLPQGALFQLNRLQWLFLGHNQIQSLDERAFLGMRRLKELELSANQLRLLPNRTFRPVPNLRLLDLSTNQVSALSSSQFRGLRKLMVLRLRRNLLTSVPVRIFQDLRKLRVLDLGENRLITLARNAFVGLLSLTELRLDQNRLNRVNLGLFARLTSLRSLNLSQNNAAWLGRTLYWHWPTLEHLDLSRNRLEWVEPTAFYGVPRLKSLLLHSNHLQVLERNVLQNWVSLENLTLSGNPWDCGQNICTLAAWLGRYRGQRDNGPVCSMPEEAKGENVLDAVHAFQTCQPHVLDFNAEKNITVEINTNTEMDITVETDTVVITTETEWYIVTETTEQVLMEEYKEEEEEEEQYSAVEPFTVTPDAPPQKRHLAMERTIVVSTVGLS